MFTTPCSVRPFVLALAAAATATTATKAQLVAVASTAPFTDISTTGSLIGTVTDDIEFVVTGAALTTAGFTGNQLLAGGVNIRIGNNGGVIWGNSATDTFANATEVGAINAINFPAMTAGNSGFGVPTGNGGLAPRQFIAVHWDDLYPTTANGTNVRWQVIGGNLIVQWTNEGHFNFQAGPITFQVVVYSGRTIASGQPLIEMVYNDTLLGPSQFQNDGGSATIGYKNWGIVAAANDVEFGAGGGNGANLTDAAYGDPTMRPKVAGYAAAENSSLPHAVAIKGTASCPVDFDNNGLIEPSDIAGFVNLWFTSVSNGTLAGDFDGNGAVEPADIALFVNRWFTALSGTC